jgi:hypothetical protein
MGSYCGWREKCERLSRVGKVGPRLIVFTQFDPPTDKGQTLRALIGWLRLRGLEQLLDLFRAFTQELPHLGLNESLISPPPSPAARLSVIPGANDPSVWARKSGLMPDVTQRSHYNGRAYR